MLESQSAPNFTRDIKTIQEVPHDEAKRMIKAEICVEYKEGKDVELDYKRKLKDVNTELEQAFDDLKEVKSAHERKIKALNDELKKTKAALKAGKKTGKKTKK